METQEVQSLEFVSLTPSSTRVVLSLGHFGLVALLDNEFHCLRFSAACSNFAQQKLVPVGSLSKCSSAFGQPFVVDSSSLRFHLLEVDG